MTMSHKRLNISNGSYPLTFFLILLSGYNSQLNRVSENLNPIKKRENMAKIRNTIADKPSYALYWAYALFRSLNDKGYDVMTLRFHDMRTLRDISKERYVSAERIRQLQNSYVYKLQHQPYIKQLAKGFGLIDSHIKENEKKNGIIALFGDNAQTIEYYQAMHFNQLFDLNIETQDDLDEFLRKD